MEDPPTEFETPNNVETCGKTWKYVWNMYGISSIEPNGSTFSASFSGLAN